MVSSLRFQKPTVFENFIFNKDYTFCIKNLFFTTKDAQSIAKIRILVTFLYFQV